MQSKGFALALAALLIALVAGLALAPKSEAQAPPTPGSATFNYDSIGQVVQESYPASSAQYTFDSSGNRVTVIQN